MRDSTKSPALAIDGGGTKCRFALQTADTRVVFEAGSANVSTDFTAAVTCIKDGLIALAQAADTQVDTLYDTPAFVGLAGVTGPQMAARLTDALPLQKATYADDRRAALRGALGDGDGLIAHCGTGSFLAAQIDGAEKLTGGWGPILGDEASAQWVGRLAIAKMLRQRDGFLPPSPLTEELMARFQTTAYAVQYAQEASPSDLGSLAPLVTQHAAQGDAVAIAILQAGANHIASDLKQMGWKPGLAICLTGGIAPHYAPYLPDDMTAALREPKGEPLDGAIALAQEKEMADGRC